ncbi:MAG: hypothetical protein RL015_1312 [Verrucomicrobiota bacterium]
MTKSRLFQGVNGFCFNRLVNELLENRRKGRHLRVD